MTTERSVNIDPVRLVSIVIPTLREAANLPELVKRIDAATTGEVWSVELLIMDDNSGDGIDDVARELGRDWVTVVIRTADYGLAAAVLDGMRRARGDVLIVMDADLSHPPEAIPALAASVGGGSEFAVGSRYVDGGSLDGKWGFHRRLTSRVATQMARGLTRISDPMSGFFAINRQVWERGRDLDPVGFKILLELLVKCEGRSVVEVPIHFGQRLAGESKLGSKEILRYLKHLRRLKQWRKANATSHAGAVAISSYVPPAVSATQTSTSRSSSEGTSRSV